MSFRTMCQVLFGALVAATACGGNVKNGPGTPDEQLRVDGAGQCKSACATVVKCGGGVGSCSCGCVCATGATDCSCPPCTCTDDLETPAECESECNTSLQKVLAGDPSCQASMVTLLDCLSSATCKAGELPCKAESEALKSCEQTVHSTLPPSTTVSPSITCTLSSEAGPQAPGSPAPAPGAPFCQLGWDGCTDGRSYSVECRVAAGSNLACDCLVDGVPQSSFTAMSCTRTVVDANDMCDWHL